MKKIIKYFIIWILFPLPLLAQWKSFPPVSSGSNFQWNKNGEMPQTDSLRTVEGTGVTLAQSGHTLTISATGTGGDITAVTVSAPITGGASSGSANVAADTSSSDAALATRAFVKNAPGYLGDITAVNVTAPITGGGTSGSVTIAADTSSGNTHLASQAQIKNNGGWTKNGTTVSLTTITNQVGIGTASPTASYELDVSGDIIASGNINGTAGNSLTVRYGVSNTVDSGVDRGTVVGNSNTLRGDDCSIFGTNNISGSSTSNIDNIQIGTGNTIGTNSQTIQIGNNNNTDGQGIYLAHGLSGTQDVAAALQAGSATLPLTTLLVGNGNTVSSPSDFTWRQTNASGTNTQPSNLIITACLGTGNNAAAATGSIFFRTGITGSSGSTLQSVKNRMFIGRDGTNTAAPTDSLFGAIGGHFARGLKVDNQLNLGSSSVSGLIGFTATDGDAGTVNIGTSDQLTFSNFSGGYNFDNGGGSFTSGLSVSGLDLSYGTGITLDNSAVSAGNDAFTTTAVTDTVTVSGADVTDLYWIQITGTSAPAATDAIAVEALSGKFVVHRGVAGTSGLTYNWKREKP